jgi:2-hydroxycyclohexanecarboxyl-CoA dehydrogenase
VAIGDVLATEAEETAAAITARAGRAAAVTLDVTSASAAEAGVDRAARALGPIEILVNNAGWDELKPFLETDEASWDRIIEINFKGPLRLTKHVLPGMLERGFGRIVNIASDAARVGSSLESVYAGAKAGVVAFTKTIAREAAGAGVTANAVCPGPTRTPLLEEIVSGHPRGEAVIEAMVRSIPMRRLAEPGDVAAAVSFLASDEAAYVTGQTLSVSGGLTMT